MQSTGARTIHLAICIFALCTHSIRVLLTSLCFFRLLPSKMPHSRHTHSMGPIHRHGFLFIVSSILHARRDREHLLSECIMMTTSTTMGASTKYRAHTIIFRIFLSMLSQHFSHYFWLFYFKLYYFCCFCFFVYRAFYVWVSVVRLLGLLPAQ